MKGHGTWPSHQIAQIKNPLQWNKSSLFFKSEVCLVENWTRGEWWWYWGCSSRGSWEESCKPTVKAGVGPVAEEMGGRKFGLGKWKKSCSLGVWDDLQRRRWLSSLCCGLLGGGERESWVVGWVWGWVMGKSGLVICWRDVLHFGVTGEQLCHPQITQVASDVVSDFGDKPNLLSWPRGPCRGRLKCPDSELNSEYRGFTVVSSRSPPLTYHIKLSFLDIPLVFFKNYLFIFGCAGSPLPWGLFSRCGEWGLLISCRALASHRSGFSHCWSRTVGRADFSSLWL